MARRQPGDRRRDARVVPRGRPPGDRHATASSPTASRSPTPAWTGTRPSRCSTRLAGAVRARPRGMRIAVLGVGLIGGSIGMAARRIVAGAEVVGFGRDPARLERWPGSWAPSTRRRARSRRRSRAPRRALPARRWARCPSRCAPRSRRRPRTAWSPTWAPPSAELLAAIDDPRFVGGHPIAGAETSGVEHARADLFQGAVWYLTPHGDAPPACSTSASTAW